MALEGADSFRNMELFDQLHAQANSMQHAEMQSQFDHQVLEAANAQINGRNYGIQRGPAPFFTPTLGRNHQYD